MDILSKTGKSIVSLTVDQIKEKHLLALQKEPIAYNTSLSNIEIIDENFMRITHDGNNIDMRISEKAYSDILDIGLLDTRIKKKFQTILKDKDKTIDILNKFRKELISNNGDIPISLIGDKNEKIITTIKPKKEKFEIIRHDEFLKTVYQITNMYDLKIVDFNIGNNGEININTMLDDNSPMIIKGLDSKFGLPENEVFNRGLYFQSAVGDYKIIPSTIRILCSNQITLNNISDSINIQNLKIVGKQRVFNHLEKLKHHNFIPASFERQIQRAFSTPASLDEYEYITNNILTHTELEKEDLDSYINYSEIMETFENYQKKSDTILTQTIKSQIPTNRTIWQLVNAITYVASNLSDNLISPNQRNYLRSISGNFLKGDIKNNYFDLQMKFDTPYSNYWQ